MLYKDLTMDIVKEKLYKGQKFKSVQALARHLGFELTQGVYRKKQVAYMKTFFSYYKPVKNSNRVVIREIFEQQKIKSKKIKKPQYPQFMIEKDKENCRGIYAIVNNRKKEIFIGFAYGRDGLKGKFLDCKEKKSTTKKMLSVRTTKFYCLAYLGELEDVSVMKTIVNELIEWTSANTKYLVLNHANNKEKLETIKFQVTQREKELMKEYFKKIRNGEI